jgi:hypothetical protein
VRSSDARPPGELRATLIAVGCAALAAVIVSFSRADLARRFHELRVTSDVYALPSPQQTIAVSLGYRSALADYIYAKVLVSAGLHFEDRRRFTYVGNYIDAINALDPKFRTPYIFADTLLTLQPVKARFQDYAKAREILERGMKARPYDAELWTSAGQFLAYLAPPWLPTKAQQKEWRLAGARALAHACEIAGPHQRLSYRCITAASLLSRAGQREAMEQFLKRVLAVTDDPKIRKLALGYMEHARGEEQQEAYENGIKRFNAVWGGDLRYVSKDLLLVVGPPFDTARCAGLARVGSVDCATTWRAWSAAETVR